jgi:hypothetical protein
MESKINKARKREYRRYERIIHLRWIGPLKFFSLVCGVDAEPMPPINGFHEERHEI